MPFQRYTDTRCNIAARMPSSSRAPAALDVGRQQPAGLFRQIDQDGTRLEDREIISLSIDNGGNAPIGIDLEKIRRLLITLVETYGVDLI